MISPSRPLPDIVTRGPERCEWSDSVQGASHLISEMSCETLSDFVLEHPNYTPHTCCAAHLVGMIRWHYTDPDAQRSEPIRVSDIRFNPPPQEDDEEDDNSDEHACPTCGSTDGFHTEDECFQ